MNGYAIFAELSRGLTSLAGRAGLILPLGIATDDTTKLFTQRLITERELTQLTGFENEDLLFPGVHHAFKFCLITRTAAGRGPETPAFSFYLRHPSQLREVDRVFTLDADEIALLNPNTRTCPIFRTRLDAEITCAAYRRVPVLLDKAKGAEGNPWETEFLQGLFNMTSDSKLFYTASQLRHGGWTLEGNTFSRGADRYVPLYEAKMVHQFDHRFGTYDGQTEAQANQGKLPELDDAAHDNPFLAALPRYWVPAAEVERRVRDRWDRCWLLSWRRSSRSTDERTFISTVIPRLGVGDSLFLMFPKRGNLVGLVANLGAFVLDYLTRQKLGGTNSSFFIVEQLPVLQPDRYETPVSWSGGTTVAEWLRPRLLELVYTSWELQPFAGDLGYDGPPFGWDPDRRFQLRCELDAAFFHLYGIAREGVAYVMDTFPIVRASDEKAHGSYRTKEAILDLFNQQRGTPGITTDNRAE